MAEEVFQAGLIPSDTDFRIFRDFGPVPGKPGRRYSSSTSIIMFFFCTSTGLDMAGVYNGYVYHTKYDRFDVISRKSLQNTGENLLSLVRSIANAEEMRDTEVGNLSSSNKRVYLDNTPILFIYL